MDPVFLLAVVVIVFALGFDFTNGFHDASNAIATSVATGALRPRVALFMAAVMNFAGALLSVKVAETIADIIAFDSADNSVIERLWIVFAALIGAIGWNVFTWWRGIPSSSSHSLIGGIVGAGLASATTVHWSRVIDDVLIPMVLSPIIGFFGAALVMLAIMWGFRRTNAVRANRGFRFAQSISAAAVALGHGLQDAQKTMGVIVLALVAADLHSGTSVPQWVSLSAALAIALGTYSGGWRLIRTLGRKIIDLEPPSAFAAEATAASVLYVAALGLGAPVSTTHTVTSAIMGSGAARRSRAVRWKVVATIALGWVVTIPAAAATAAAVYLAVRLF